MNRNKWIQNLIISQPDPPRLVPFWTCYRKGFLAAGNLVAFFLGLVLLSGGVFVFLSDHGQLEVIWFGIFSLIGSLLTLFAVLAPLAPLRMLRDWRIHEAIVEEVKFDRRSNATLESVNNGGIAVGRVRLSNVGHLKDDVADFECDEPWSSRIEAGSRILIFTHPRSGIICELVGLKEDIQQIGRGNE